MSDSAESEVSGLQALGNPSVEYRSADRGPTGDGPLGEPIWGRIISRGTPDRSLWNSRGGVQAGKENLRKASSR